MYPRLLLLKEFLREDGAIFVSIDDNEVATLRLLMDEILARVILLLISFGKHSRRAYQANRPRLHPNAKGEQVEGLGGGFRFCDLASHCLMNAATSARACALPILRGMFISRKQASRCRASAWANRRCLRV